MKGGMRLENKYIMIPNDFIDGEKKLNSDKLLLLTILLQGRTGADTCLFSIRYLCRRLNTTTGNTNRTKFIIDTLKYFQDKDILFFSDTIECDNEINIEKVTKQNKMDVFFSELQHEIGKFTKLYYNELKIILDYCNNNKVDKYLITHLYLYIIRLIETNADAETYKLSYPSIEKMATFLNISENTVLKYIKALRENMTLLYYDNVGYRIVNGKYKATKTYYCRMDDKEFLDNRISIENKDKSITPLNKKEKSKINNKRSLKQKINNLTKKLNKSEEEMEELKSLEKQYNKLTK
jgi:biotin operon repressor